MERDEDEGVRKFEVKLHAYKIESVSESRIRDLWIGGIVAHGREYVFSQAGIESFRQRCTLLGEPTRVELLGHTEVPYAVFLDFIVAHSSAEFSSDKFSLGRTDFNSFCKEGAAFLCGAGLPDYLSLPIDPSSPELGALAPVLSAESLADPGDPSASVITFARQKGASTSAAAARKEDLDVYLDFQPRVFQREPSPGLDELEAEIEALKQHQRKIQEDREKKLKELLDEEEQEEKELVKQIPAPKALTQEVKQQLQQEQKQQQELVSTKKKKRPSGEKKEKRKTSRKKSGEKNASASDSNIPSRSEKDPSPLVKRSATADRELASSSSATVKKRVSFREIPEEIATAAAAASTASNNSDAAANHSEDEEEDNSVEVAVVERKVTESDLNCKNEKLRLLDEEEQQQTQSEIIPTGDEEELVKKPIETKAEEKPRTPEPKSEVQVFKLEQGGDSSAKDSSAAQNGLSNEEEEEEAAPESEAPEEEATAGEKSSEGEDDSRKKKRAARLAQVLAEMSEGENGNAAAAAAAAPEGEGGEAAAPPQTRKKDQKPSEPPVTFREFEQMKDFEDLVRTIVTLVDPEDQDRLREMEDWIIKNEGTWVLSEGFNSFLGRVLHEQKLPSDGRVAMLRLLAYGAGQDDIVLVMHSDRKDHLIMNYAQGFDRLPIKEQEATALFFANLFETNSASEWLMYISEWTSGGMELSNIRVTTKVAVNALLGDTPALREYGTAIMHNLGTKEVKAVVFDDICTELAMAILQFFQTEGLPEEHVFRCLKALSKFATIAHRDVPQLVKMIGPDPSKFSGASPRVDALVQGLAARIAAAPSF